MANEHYDTSDGEWFSRGWSGAIAFHFRLWKLFKFPRVCFQTIIFPFTPHLHIACRIPVARIGTAKEYFPQFLIPHRMLSPNLLPAPAPTEPSDTAEPVPASGGDSLADGKGAAQGTIHLGGQCRPLQSPLYNFYKTHPQSQFFSSLCFIVDALADAATTHFFTEPPYGFLIAKKYINCLKPHNSPRIFLPRGGMKLMYNFMGSFAFANFLAHLTSGI